MPGAGCAPSPLPTVRAYAAASWSTWLADSAIDRSLTRGGTRCRTMAAPELYAAAVVPDVPEVVVGAVAHVVENGFVVESAIAGVRPEDIDIQVTADSISIRGSRRREREVSDEDYLYQECYWGRFARSIILPQEVDPDGANVTFKNGILTVRLPKVNKKKSKKLKVNLE